MSYPGLKKKNVQNCLAEIQTLITNKTKFLKRQNKWCVCTTIQLQLSGLRAVLGTCSLWITSCIWGWLWPVDGNKVLLRCLLIISLNYFVQGFYTIQDLPKELRSCPCIVVTQPLQLSIFFLTQIQRLRFSLLSTKVYMCPSLISTNCPLPLFTTQSSPPTK